MKEEVKSVLIDGLKEQVKSYVGLIPVAGIFINQALDVRGKIKQDRLLNFLEAFVKYCEDLKEEDINTEELQKEEFGDILEEIFIKVSKTTSKEKLNAYSRILKQQIKEPFEINEVELYLSVISELNITDILLLDYYYYNEIRFNFTFADNKIQPSGIQNFKELYEKYSNIEHTLYNLRSLQNKGLIENNDYKTNYSITHSALNFQISEFGKKCIQIH